MALCRWVLPDSGWRRYACTLSLVVATNIITALVFSTDHSPSRESRDPELLAISRDDDGRLGNAFRVLPYSSTRNCSQSYNINRPDYQFLFRTPTLSPHLPTIFIITPTHACATQKVDLTSLCHTLTLVPKLTWIVIEDSKHKTRLVTDLLARCMSESVHLNEPTSDKYKTSLPWPLYRMFGTVRGVEQRNAGLRWLREHLHPHNSSGVVYFIDDDNKVDARLFTEVRCVSSIS